MASNLNTGSVPKEGDRFPSGATLFEGAPDKKVEMDSLLKGKKVVIFGVPGAFTPGCSATHLPGYVKDFDRLKGKGIDEIICIACNDPFVMGEWGKAHHAEGKVRMLADPRAELAKQLGVALDLTGALGSVRCKRFSMIVDDGVVKQVNVEPEADPTGLTCSLASALKL